MRVVALILIALVTLSSCGSSKTKTASIKKEKVSKNASTVADKVVNTALEYDGVKYKYGGETKKGMDCSGLIVTAFKSEAILLPRTTNELKTSGNWIDLKEVQKGDLLFFATRKNSRRINHVGIVTDINKDQIQFIHSTTSKGVITSQLSEKYWYFAFVQARRIL